jgi:hypothetical protein
MPGTAVVNEDGLLGFVLREQYRPDPPRPRTYTVISDAGHGPEKYTYGHDELRVARTRQDFAVDIDVLRQLLQYLAAECILLGIAV